MVLISLLLFVVGLIIGFLSSFFGIGGGLIFIPGMYALFPGISPSVVIGTSMAMVWVTSIITVFQFWRKGFVVSWRFLLMIAPTMMMGMSLAAFGVKGLSSSVLKQIFALLLLVSAWRIFFEKGDQNEVETKNDLGHQKSWNLFYRIAFIGFVTGIASGLTGLGGAIIMIPLFTRLLGMPLKLVALHTSSVMAVVMLWGVLQFMWAFTPSAFVSHIPTFPIELYSFQVGAVNWAIVCLIELGVLVTSPFGIRVAQSLSPKRLKWAFIAMLLILALLIFRS